MSSIRIIDLKETVLENNDADAQVLRNECRDKRTFYINIMSSPGSGKTSVILQTVKALKDKYRIGVMEADIDSDVDAKAVADAGVQAIQLHTGGMCHLDADMSRQGLKELGAEELDLVILENVGNLVCPAEFDTGAGKNVVILSVPEGDDKPLKYPLIFRICDVVLINKIDAAPAFDFDISKAESHIRERNPKAVIIPVSAKTGEGMDEWCGWLSRQIDEWNGQVK